MPGLGAKTARRLYDELGIATARGAQGGGRGERIRDLKGLGAKVEENVLASIERLGEPGEGPGRLLLSQVRPIAEELAAALREHPAANRVEVAGSARRWAETCKDIDLIATAEEPAALAEHLASHPLIAAAGKPGANGRPRRRPTTGSRSTCGSSPRAPSATCSSTSPAPRPTTCSCAKRRSRRGLSVSEHGITETESGKVDLCETEEGVYERLGYAYIDPELREGRGELRRRREGKLPELISARGRPR